MAIAVVVIVSIILVLSSPCCYGQDDFECTPQCKNGGTCIATNQCACQEGYSSRDCSKKNQCENGGCNEPNGFCSAANKCVCKNLFTGPNCEVAPRLSNKRPPPVTGDPQGRSGLALASCNPQCKNGGRCVSFNNCFCQDGWLGADCSQPQCNGGCNEPNGVCSAPPDKCVCKNGYSGLRCSTAPQPAVQSSDTQIKSAAPSSHQQDNGKTMLIVMIIGSASLIFTRN